MSREAIVQPMKQIISIAAWTTGLLTMLTAMLIVCLCSFVLKGRRLNAFTAFMCRCIVRAFWVRVRREGMDNIVPGRSRLFMSNHASFIDLFVLAGYLPGYKLGIEAAEHFSWPVYGFFVKRIGMIPIDRSNVRASIRSIGKAAEFLHKGISMLILPESTRSTDGKLLPFKKLPFKLARMGKAEVVPVGLVGTFDFKPKMRSRIEPRQVILRFGEPISAEKVTEMDTSRLMEMTRERIAGLVES